MSSILEGSCHCGAIAIRLDTEFSADELPLRRCSCGFCGRHRPRYTADPQGRAVIAARQQDLGRYRFGTRTADFLLCKHCGVFLGAACEQDGRWLSVLNVNNFAYDVPGKPGLKSFDGESADERRERRARTWTPTTIEER